ncbi:MAG TPA: glycosyltransferase family 4 protein [Thermoanaerobaculia bacterium]|nr:glycosyltransferase family 4 protein [Thermoanaerobaculia bacterium]
MRILIYSPAFLPAIGGLEITTSLLAEGLAESGQEVTVVTRTPGEPQEAPYRVVRDPAPLEVLRWTRWCDVFVQQNVSLRGLWPLLLIRRPWVVFHHSWYCQSDGRITWRDRLKRRLLRFSAASIPVSQALADDLGTPSVVIPNPYRESLFRVLPGIERTGELLFVGRLVSDKGVDLLLDALALLSREGLEPRLTVVGEGPEAPRLREQAGRLGIAGRVELLGTRRDETLVEILNRHRILVVPSRYNEPFGIVALEGIACGCVVVGSRGGGLGEAIGDCGRTFPNGDAGALARELAELLRHPEADSTYRRHAARHLARHRTEAVTAATLRLFETLLPRGARSVGRTA